MPTGYTAGIADGTTTTFPDFAMQCARGFGALVMMRDEASTAKIPDILVADTAYHDKAIADARADLARLEALADVECSAAARADFGRDVDRQESRLQENGEKRSRYEAMLAQVEAWTPPSPDHREMKRFMKDQIVQSIDFDCPDDPLRYYDKPKLLSGSVWRANGIAKANENIAYHTKKIAEEIARTEGRNNWLTLLRQSLPVEA